MCKEEGKDEMILQLTIKWMKLKVCSVILLLKEIVVDF